MVMRVLLTYLTVELIAVIALVWAVGPWWTIAIVAGSVLLGPLLVGSQVRKQLAGLRRATRRPDQAVTDGLLVGVGSTLILVPGLVSTALGGLMLAPPTRGAMRPLAQMLLTRGLARRFAAVDLTVRSTRADVVDGEVIDAEVIDAEVIGADRFGRGVTPNLPAVR
ncbi:MAG: FxsA family protein [Mycobacterium sp.]|nr:MAG: FxsA family protein [Mycobacterium sp.]HQE14043.1 FxsA family protein [Mycobacterium sp.]